MVLPRRLAEAAHLAHELACGGADLLLRGDYVSLAQGLDASAHATKIRGRSRLATPMPTLPRLSRLPVRRQLRELWRRQPARVETGTLQHRIRQAFIAPLRDVADRISAGRHQLPEAKRRHRPIRQDRARLLCPTRDRSYPHERQGSS